MGNGVCMYVYTGNGNRFLFERCTVSPFSANFVYFPVFVPVLCMTERWFDVDERKLKNGLHLGSVFHGEVESVSHGTLSLLDDHLLKFGHSLGKNYIVNL